MAKQLITSVFSINLAHTANSFCDKFIALENHSSRGSKVVYFLYFWAIESSYPEKQELVVIRIINNNNSLTNSFGDRWFRIESFSDIVKVISGKNYNPEQDLDSLQSNTIIFLQMYICSF